MIVERLQATRLRLLDVYGHAAPAAEPLHRARADGARAVPRAPAARQETADTWTLELEPSNGAGLAAFAPGPVQHALRVRRRRGADLDQRRPGRPGAARAHRPRGRRGDRGDLRRRARATLLGVRGPVRQRLAGRRGRGRRRGGRRRRHRPRAAAPGAPARRCAQRERLRPRRCCSTAAATPEQLLYRARARALARTPELERAT